MNVLTVDVGGTNVKVIATGQDEPRKFPSGPKMKPEQMVSRVQKIAEDWKYDVVSMGTQESFTRESRLRNHVT